MDLSCTAKSRRTIISSKPLTNSVCLIYAHNTNIYGNLVIFENGNLPILVIHKNSKMALILDAMCIYETSTEKQAKCAKLELI